MPLKGAWKEKAPLKIHTFGWRVFLNKLPTKDQLTKRGILQGVQDKVCVFCCEENEDIHYLLLHCTITRKVWEVVDSWLGICSMVGSNSRANFNRYISAPSKNLRNNKEGLVWFSTCWRIWIIKNSILFQGRVFNL